MKYFVLRSLLGMKNRSGKKIDAENTEDGYNLLEAQMITIGDIGLSYHHFEYSFESRYVGNDLIVF